MLQGIRLKMDHRLAATNHIVGHYTAVVNQTAVATANAAHTAAVVAGVAHLPPLV